MVAAHSGGDAPAASQPPPIDWRRLVCRAKVRGRLVPVDTIEKFIKGALAEFPAARGYYMARWERLRLSRERYVFSVEKIRKKASLPPDAKLLYDIMVYVTKDVTKFLETAETVRFHLSALAEKQGVLPAASTFQIASKLHGILPASSRIAAWHARAFKVDPNADSLSTRFDDAATAADLEDILFDIACQLVAERRMNQPKSGGGANAALAKMSYNALMTTSSSASSTSDSSAIAIVRSAFGNIRDDVILAMSRDTPTSYRRNAVLRIIAIAGMAALGIVCIASPALFGVGAFVCPVLALVAKGASAVVHASRESDNRALARLGMNDRSTILFVVVNNLTIIEAMAELKGVRDVKPWHKYLLDCVAGRLTSRDASMFALMTLTEGFGRDREPRDAAYLHAAYMNVRAHIRVMIKYRAPPSCDSYGNARYAPGSGAPTCSIADAYGKDHPDGPWSLQSIRAFVADLRELEDGLLESYVAECDRALAGIAPLLKVRNADVSCID